MEQGKTWLKTLGEVAGKPEGIPSNALCSTPSEGSQDVVEDPREWETRGSEGKASHAVWSQRVEKMLVAECHKSVHFGMTEEALKSVVDEGKLVALNWEAAWGESKNLSLDDAHSILRCLEKAPVRHHPGAFEARPLGSTMSPPVAVLASHFEAKWKGWKDDRPVTSDSSVERELCEMADSLAKYHKDPLIEVAAEHFDLFKGVLRQLDDLAKPWWVDTPNWGSIEASRASIAVNGFTKCNPVEGLVKAFVTNDEIDKSVQLTKGCEALTRDANFAAKFAGYSEEQRKQLDRLLAELQGKQAERSDMIVAIETLSRLRVEKEHEILPALKQAAFRITVPFWKDLVDLGVSSAKGIATESPDAQGPADGAAPMEVAAGGEEVAAGGVTESPAESAEDSAPLAPGGGKGATKATAKAKAQAVAAAKAAAKVAAKAAAEVHGAESVSKRRKVT